MMGRDGVLATFARGVAGADIALTPGSTSFSDRLMPWPRTSCNCIAKSVQFGNAGAGGIPNADETGGLRCAARRRSSSSSALTTAASR